MRRLILLIPAVAIVAASCGGSGSTDTSDSQTTGTGLPDSPDRCEVADPAVLAYLSDGFISEDFTMPWGFAVKTTDYPDVWIVAGAVQGPNDIDYGTWAIRAGTWPVDFIAAISVDLIAETVSVWGDDTSIEVSEFTDGVRSAGACAIEKLDG
jgi:hypothetical protein